MAKKQISNLQKEINRKKQLANLRPVKPGEVRNPEGGRAHNPAIRALKNFTHETFREVLEVALTGKPGDLDAIIDDPESTNLEIIVAKAFRDSVDTGSYSLVERIAERLLGKPP